MKTLFTLAFLFVGLNLAVCQDTESTIENTKIRITNSEKRAYSLGSAVDLKKAFGDVEAQRDTDEVQGGYGYTYRYKGMTTYFFQKRWDNTIITDKQYSILLDKRIYKVGDPISKLKLAFPGSYNARRKNDGIRIWITHKKNIVDAFVFIIHDVKGQITEIWIGCFNG